MAQVAHRKLLIAIILLAAAMLAVFRADRVPVAERLGVAMSLPARVGDRAGVDILFCQNETCARSFRADLVADRSVCPVCGGRLDPMSVAERNILPLDTVILRKEYTGLDGVPIVASMVISGSEQKSIHRPEQCLPAQGLVIERNRVISVPLAGRRDLDVMLLDLRQAGSPRGGLSCYAYWFVGAGRETPRHLERLFWMSFDRIFRNVASRWAYIAVTTDRRDGSDAYLSRLRSFIADLYPLILPHPAR